MHPFVARWGRTVAWCAALCGTAVAAFPEVIIVLADRVRTLLIGTLDLFMVFGILIWAALAFVLCVASWAGMVHLRRRRVAWPEWGLMAALAFAQSVVLLRAIL